MTYVCPEHSLEYNNAVGVHINPVIIHTLGVFGNNTHWYVIPRRNMLRVNHTMVWIIVTIGVIYHPWHHL